MAGFLDLVNLRRGEYLFREDEPIDKVYFILAGELAVIKRFQSRDMIVE